MIEEIKTSPLVEKAYPGEIGITRLPEPSLAVAQATFTKKASEQIFLEDAQLFSKGNPQVKIAVLDTGVDYTHPEFNHAMLPGMDFVDIINGSDRFIGDYLGEDSEPLDEVGHGSHVTGIISARGNKMPMGVVPTAGSFPYVYWAQ